LFIGHALLAFALAVLFAQWRDWPTDRALAVGLAAGAFAAVPDVDVLYALVAVDPTALFAGPAVQPGAFWDGANQAHRGVTHSLVVAAVAGVAFWLWTRASTPVPSGRRELASTAGAVFALAALVAVAAVVSGFVGAFVMTAFVLAGLAVATVARSRLELSPRLVGLAAAFGIASHPWGDMVTGSPPALLYPVDAGLLDGRVVLSSDPTLHLLGAFGLELATVALALAVLGRQYGYSPHRLVDRRAALGVLYGAGAVVMVPPTIEVSYHFVFSILAVGAVCGSTRSIRWERYTPENVAHRLAGDGETALATAATAVAGVAVALVSYGVVYLLLG